MSIPIEFKSRQIDNRRIARTAVAVLLVHLSLTCAWSQTLLHRYSFTTDASDSVGNADGALIGDAVIVDGAVVLNGNKPTFVDLPRDLATNLTSFTFETWVTWAGGDLWQRIFDFGNSTLGPGVPGAGTASLAMTTSCPLSGGTPPDMGTFIQTPGSFLIWSSANLTTDPLPAGFLQHLAWTYDKPSKTSTLYLNGQAVAVNVNQTLSPADVGPTDNCWLGRSQNYLDPDFNGSISEFRIYDGALSAEAVAAHYLEGPDMAGRGSLTGIRLLATTTMRAGTKQQLQVAADFQNVSNLQFTTNAGMTYLSSDTNALSISASGLLTAVGTNSATANVIASYQGLTSTQTIAVVAFPAATLLHRYSFINDASDSVGTAHGALQGNASISNGVVVLNGNNSWVKMPPNLCSDLSNLTFEFWLTWSGSQPWQRIFDFGSNSGNIGDGYGYAKNTICLVALDGYQATDGGGYLSLIVFDASSVQRSQVSIAPLTAGIEHQLVWTLDDLNSTARLFVDGVQAGEGTMTATFAGFGEAPNCWLGESQFRDPEFLGNLNDLRIYDNALSPQTIAAHYTAGPNDGVNTDLGTLRAIRVLGRTNMLSGLSQQLTVFGDYQNASNVVVTNAVFQVSSAATLSITSQGWLTAHAPTTTNASVTATVFGQSYTFNVHVIVPPAPNLLHRYSFISDASDSVGTAHGVLKTNAVCVNGAVVFDGTNSWVELPAQFVTNLTDLTFEFWLTWNGGPLWQHIFDFGNNIGNYGNGYGYALNDFCLVTETAWFATDGGGHLALLTFTTPGLQKSQLFAPTLTTGVKHHVVWTYNEASATAQLFIDGVLANYNTDLSYTFKSFHDAPNCWLGQSQFNDSQFNGSIDEFRIYDGALTAEQVAFNGTLGPDLMAAPVQIAGRFASGQITLSWPVLGSDGYSLESASSLQPASSWAAVGITPTVVSGQNQVTVPATDGARFFRLAR